MNLRHETKLVMSFLKSYVYFLIRAYRCVYMTENIFLIRYIFDILLIHFHQSERQLVVRSKTDQRMHCRGVKTLPCTFI